MKRTLCVGLFLIPLLLLGIWLLINRYADSVTISKTVSISGPDLIAFYYGIFPIDKDFNALGLFTVFFSGLSLPFLVAVFLTSMYLSKYVLPMRYYTLIRHGAAWRWLQPTLYNTAMLQALFFLLFNASLYALFTLIWGNDMTSGYWRQSITFPYHFYTSLVSLVLRQIGWMTAAAFLHVYMAVKYGNIKATFTVLILALSQLFVAYIGLLTPFHLILSQMLMVNQAVKWAFVLLSFLVAALAFAAVYFRSQKFEFSRNEVEI